MSKQTVKDRVRKWRKNQIQKGGKSISVILDPDSSNQLEDLRNLGHLKTISEVINRSISLFKFCIEKEKMGYEIYAIPANELNSSNNLKEKIYLLSSISNK